MGYAAVSIHSLQIRRSNYLRGETIAEMVGRGWEAMMLQSGPSQASEFLGLMVGHRPDLESISVIRPTGDIAFSSASERIGTRPYSSVADFGESTVTISKSASEYAIVLPIHNRVECVRCHGPESKTNGWLDVRFSTSSIETAEDALRDTLLLVGIPGLVVFVLLLWWLLDREAIAPLERLAGVMKSTELGDASVRADLGLPGEIGIVAKGFDDTMSALRSSQAKVEVLYQEHMSRAARLATIGELSLFLAHEIRNPLAGLSSALEILAADVKGTSREAVVDEMQHQVMRLNGTMESLLSYARPQRVKLRTLNVNDRVERVLFLIAQRSNGVTIRRDLRAERPVRADGAQIEQVLLNLCLNSVQAMAEGGTLTVRTSIADERVSVEVEDTGPGISTEARESLFRPFFTTKQNGTGLGLAIAERIVAEHGGLLSYECPADGGTLFRFDLQVASDVPRELDV
ncbi:MAG: sensor histidine kinase [Deltaproteobacteria bacterium]|nr:sensor histidine kinase [Deltaproteobacteria bacterium]